MIDVTYNQAENLKKIVTSLFNYPYKIIYVRPFGIKNDMS